MKLQITGESAALVAANTHGGKNELAFLSVEGALLTFDLGDHADASETVNAIRAADEYLAQLIADADDDAEISQLSALKRQVVGIERDALREHQYKIRAREEAEATAAEQESQLQGEQHTDITGSSNSDGADFEEKEVSENGTQEEQSAGQQRKRRSRG